MIYYFFNFEMSICEKSPALRGGGQGVRVAADRLTPGIYIVRQGNRATKVLVK